MHNVPHDVLWTLIICGGWMLALVFGLALASIPQRIQHWCDERRGARRTRERRLRELGRWRRVQESRLSQPCRDDSLLGATQQRKLQRRV